MTSGLGHARRRAHQGRGKRAAIQGEERGKGKKKEAEEGREEGERGGGEGRARGGRGKKIAATPKKNAILVSRLEGCKKYSCWLAPFE